ncbi:TonB-dependent receptor, partial [Vibrio fortis]
PFNGEDVAYRLALAGIEPKFDWLAAYAYRNRGNYYSGTSKADFYSKPFDNNSSDQVAGRNPLLRPEHMALVHYPGHEVPNTSAEMESALLKGTINFSDYYKLHASIRYTESTHGEILASRSDYRNSDGLAQWPLANAKMQAYTLKFRANPEHDLLNLSANLWLTKTDSRSNTGYGFPNFVNYKSDTPDIIINTSVVNRDEQRYGFDFNNKMLLDYYIEHQVNSGDISPLKEYKKDGYQLTYQTLETYAPEEIAQNVANAEHEVRVTFTQQNLNTEIDRLQNLIVMFPDQASDYQSQLDERRAELANFDAILQQKLQTQT